MISLLSNKNPWSQNKREYSCFYFMNMKLYLGFVLTLLLNGVIILACKKHSDQRSKERSNYPNL